MELENQKVVRAEAIKKHAGLKPVQSPAKRLSFFTSWVSISEKNKN